MNHQHVMIETSKVECTWRLLSKASKTIYSWVIFNSPENLGIIFYEDEEIDRCPTSYFCVQEGIPFHGMWPFWNTSECQSNKALSILSCTCLASLKPPQSELWFLFINCKVIGNTNEAHLQKLKRVINLHVIRLQQNCSSKWIIFPNRRNKLLKHYLKSQPIVLMWVISFEPKPRNCQQKPSASATPYHLFQQHTSP